MPTPEEAAKSAADAIASERAQAANYRNLVSKVWDDPNLGGPVRKLAKEMFPDLRLPEDTIAPALAPLLKQNEELAARLKELADDRASEKKAREDKEKADRDADFETRLKAARDKYKLTDEGFDKMVARMKETGNYTDPFAAAAFIVSENPPPAEVGPVFGPGDLNFAGSATVDPKYELLHRNPERYFDNEVRTMLQNPKAYVAQEMGPQYAELAFGR
jgi:hypothetical protein